MKRRAICSSVGLGFFSNIVVMANIKKNNFKIVLSEMWLYLCRISDKSLRQIFDSFGLMDLTFTFGDNLYMLFQNDHASTRLFLRRRCFSVAKIFPAVLLVWLLLAHFVIDRVFWYYNFQTSCIIISNYNFQIINFYISLLNRIKSSNLHLNSHQILELRIG